MIYEACSDVIGYWVSTQYSQWKYTIHCGPKSENTAMIMTTFWTPLWRW